MAFFLPFSSHALTSQTTRNAIQGSAPYLTFDGGRTRVVDANGLLGITLSDGTQYTPSTNLSSTTPIVLPVEGQSFADISMFVPTNTNSVDLSSLIGPPYNYWGDDDGDFGVSATGTLNLSIVDKYSQAVLRSTVPTICKAPYRVTLSSTNGTLLTRYGFPSRSTFGASSVIYYVNPKASPVVCFARPITSHRYSDQNGPSWIWNGNNGFLTQSVEPSGYGRNFPTTGLNGLYFDLLISGSNKPLYWSPVSLGGITVTMTNSTATSVRVTLTGPAPTPSQLNSDNPSPIDRPNLPQTFELVGRDNSGNPIVKYGFTLKQWFVLRPDTLLSSHVNGYYRSSTWCRGVTYAMPRVADLTNSSCPRNYPPCYGAVGATPRSSINRYKRYIGAGFITEWGPMRSYSVGFSNYWIWTRDQKNNSNSYFPVDVISGKVDDQSHIYQYAVLCVLGRR